MRLEMNFDQILVLDHIEEKPNRNFVLIGKALPSDWPTLLFWSSAIDRRQTTILRYLRVCTRQDKSTMYQNFAQHLLGLAFKPLGL